MPDAPPAARRELPPPPPPAAFRLLHHSSPVSFACTSAQQLLQQWECSRPADRCCVPSKFPARYSSALCRSLTTHCVAAIAGRRTPEPDHRRCEAPRDCTHVVVNLPLPPWLKTVPLPCVSTAFVGLDNAFAMCFYCLRGLRQCLCLCLCLCLWRTLHVRIPTDVNVGSDLRSLLRRHLHM